MVSKRGENDRPWMAADEYGRSLKGIGINLLVRDVARSVAFAKEVLLARVVYADADFAVLRYEQGRTAAEWMLHATLTGAGDASLVVRITAAEHDAAALAGLLGEDLALTVAPAGTHLFGADGTRIPARRLEGVA